MRGAIQLLIGSFLLGAPAGAVGADAIEYVVEPGETLWSIAGQSDVYADPYLWPLIYKFNRDQIVDPAQIHPGQTLLIPVLVDTAARSEARAQAGATEN